MGPEGNILVNSPISTFQQGLTHSAMLIQYINLKILGLNVWGLYGMSVHCPGASTIFAPF